ncbi:MAG: AAA domain-containing protein, partial [Gemmatimonadales bacterium]
MPEAPVEIGRARQLFSFLKAFAEQRMPKQRTTAQHLWSLALDDLPKHPAIAVGTVILANEQDGTSADEAAAEPLLRVTRPKLTKSPPPPAAILEFLNPGWEEPEAAVDVLASRNVPRGPETVTVYFNDDPARVAALEAWKSKRSAWATAEIPARRVMDVYSRLYALLRQIELESEQVELVLGDGRLRWNHPGGAIDHPVLLQRVELVFDTDRNEFRVVDADRPPEIYTAVLGSDDISPEQHQALREDLAKGGFHPLAGAATSGFLRRLAATLGPRCDFVEHRPGPPTSSDPVIGRDPFLILRTRPPGFVAAFDRILGDLENRNTLPTALTRVLGVDRDVPTAAPMDATPPWGEPPDVLLSKPANADQIRIAQVLEHQRAVLVQGPPGTGKSHTIANLIGHLVAQGKRVLVTSHTTKALKVLREEVVETLRPLCVAVLDNDSEGRAQLEGSIRGILSRLTASSEDHLGTEVADLALRRLALNTEIAGIVKDLRMVRLAEYEAIVIDGESIEPAAAAAWVRANAAEHSWVPGPVDARAPLPLSPDELLELYASTAQVTRGEVKELVGGLPEPTLLLQPDQFSANVAAAAMVEPSGSAVFWSRPPNESDLTALSDLDECTRQTTAALDRLASWQRAIIAIGHGDGKGPQTWVDLARMVEDARDLWERSRPVLLEHAVEQVPPGSAEEWRKVAQEIRTHVSAGGSLSLLALLTKGKWKALVRGARVNGAEPSAAADFNALAIHFALQDARSRLAVRWARLA